MEIECSMCNALVDTMGLGHGEYTYCVNCGNELRYDSKSKELVETRSGYSHRMKIYKARLTKYQWREPWLPSLSNE
jgi:hypothetical protein